MNTATTLAKVPAVTFGFWIIKIAATTLGETGGDWVTMSLNLGYLVGSAIFLTFFVVAVATQISVKNFHPYLYWAAIIATTTLGTTLADFFDRSLGASYFTGMNALFTLLILSLALWHWRTGSVAVETVASPRIEKYYWLTILFSQTLGTALGDFVADDDLYGLGLGYEWSALIFCIGLAVVAALWFWTRLSRAGLFWAAFILTRPLGATLGDFLDKPLEMGGLALSRFYATLALSVFIVVCIRVFPQRPGKHPNARETPPAL
jgi:uncharacterized membrane-anchored protein